jgi:protein-tyrosine phosphatase
MHQITDKLFVGNIHDARQPSSQVSALLLVAEEYEIDAPGGVVYGRIPFKEYGEVHPLTLASAVNWVERHVSDNRVMVCCRAGMGRSVSVVMAYLCCVEGMAYAEVLKLVMGRRPGAIPLPKLEETLQEVCRLRNSLHRPTDNTSVR